MKVVDLKNLLYEQGLSTGGNKQELIDRMINSPDFAELNIEKTVLEGRELGSADTIVQEEQIVGERKGKTLLDKKEVELPDWVAVMCDKMSERREEIIKNEIKGIESKFKKLEDKLEKVTVDHIQKLEQVNVRVDNIEEKVIKTSNEQVKLVETQERFEKKLENLQLERVKNIEYFKEDPLEKISFSDSRRDNPKDFIEIIETVKFKSNIPFKIRIGRCLQGEAKSWWDMVQLKIANIQEVEQIDYFIKLFKEKFMGLKFQQMVINDLITGNYRDFQTKLHPCAYFSMILRRALSCPQPLMEEEICDYIARHFGKKFEDAWVAKPSRSADCFMS